MSKRYWLTILIIILIVVLANYKATLAAGPWRGKIIDIETKEPLEGAVVVAVWERVYRTPTGDSSYFYEAKEILTDKEGKFEIPSYTPINLLPIISYMSGPEFTIFKPGYGSLQMELGKYLSGKKEIKPYSGKLSEYMIKVSHGVIELQKLKTREERVRNIPGGPTDIGPKKLPLFYKLINEERKYLGLEGEVWR